MPDIKLGLTGSETTLPKLRWISSAPGMTINESKQQQEYMMSDGSHRVAQFNDRYECPLSWEALSAANLAILIGIKNLSGPLHFQNNWESAAWYDVYIVSFSYAPAVELYGGSDILYSVQMLVREL